MPAHHTGRPYLRTRLHVLERDGWICQVPDCKAAGWLRDPPHRDRHLAAQAAAWIATQPTTRAIWRNAPRIRTARGFRLHPLSASADMDPPKSLGGDDRDPNQLRAAHLLCNVARGNGHPTRRPGTHPTPYYGQTPPRLAQH